MVPRIPKMSIYKGPERPIIPVEPTTRAKAHLIDCVIVFPWLVVDSKFDKNRLNP
jgi:hypothetical protein